MERNANENDSRRSRRKMVSKHQNSHPACGSFLYVLFYFSIVSVFVSLTLWLFDPALHIISHEHAASGEFRIEDRRSRNELLAQNIKFTVVIPAYNEAGRLHKMLDTTITYFEKSNIMELAKESIDEDLEDEGKAMTYEIVIVDDGSNDSTYDLIDEYFKRHRTKMRVIILKENLGKGGAVKLGVEFANGKYILMADADNATDINDLEHLYKKLREIEITPAWSNGPLGVVIGSRAHLEKESVVKRTFIRTILMKGFHTLVSFLFKSHIRDTQCGFKLFTHEAAFHLFSNLHIKRWAFDIELIYIANLLTIPVYEIPVKWQEVAGSKLIQNKIDIITTSLVMARDIFCIRLSYLVGLWRIRTLDFKEAKDNHRQFHGEF